MSSSLTKSTRLGGGTNQIGARVYNERLVLSLIRRHGRLAKAELARKTGLSAQTLTLIVNRLEIENLVQKTDLTRGKVGQPSVPYSLKPDAIFSFGVKIGRRSAEIVLCNFLGEIIARAREPYPYPTPDLILGFVKQHIRDMKKTLPKESRTRIIGVGVAMPFEIWKWHDQIKAPEGALEPWRSLDVKKTIGTISRLPVLVVNDATAACAAEISIADDGQHLNLAYLYVGWFIGGGIVLNGSLFPGPSGNAGAYGALPIYSKKGPVPLFEKASLYTLEEKLIKDGHDPSIIWSPQSGWSNADKTINKWIAEVAEALSMAVLATVSILDFECAVIDGAFPASVRDRLVEAVNEIYTRQDHRGVSDVEILAGHVGYDARSVGAAMLPILANFTLDRDVLFKETDLG